MRTFVSSLASFLAVILVLGTALTPRVRADCSVHEITAVVLFDNLGTTATLRLQRLHIRPVLDIINPPDEQLLAAVNAVFENDPYRYSFRRIATASHCSFYVSSPGDFGAVAIVDSRTGEVVFAGSVVWAGTGSLRIPLTATHEISTSSGLPAAPPTRIDTIPALEWYWEWPEPQQVTEDAVEFLRQTDLLRGFAACGDYSVVGFTYTPTIGLIDPEIASQVIIVNGRSTPPWATTVHPTTWSQVKAVFR